MLSVTSASFPSSYLLLVLYSSRPRNVQGSTAGIQHKSRSCGFIETSLEFVFSPGHMVTVLHLLDSCTLKIA